MYNTFSSLHILFKVIPTIQNRHWRKKYYELFELWSEYNFVVITASTDSMFKRFSTTYNCSSVTGYNYRGTPVFAADHGGHWTASILGLWTTVYHIQLKQTTPITG